MSTRTIVLRSTKGLSLTHAEMDGNFSGLDQDLAQVQAYVKVAGVGNIENDPASIEEDYAIAIGSDAKASEDKTLAIGRKALASDDNAVAIGRDATASGYTGLAIGHTATASGHTALAIGREAVAAEESTIAIGREANASGEDNIAIGQDAKASGEDEAIAIGKNAEASGDDAIALGYDAVASGKNAVAIGEDAKATHENSVALGHGSETDAANTVSLGDRRITYVADGVNPTDAATVGQLTQMRSIHNLPTSNIGPIVVVDAAEVWVWVNTSYYTGYRSPLCGRPVDGHTVVPLASEIDAAGGLLSKTAYARLWGYAQENGLVVAQNTWSEHIGAHWFVDVSATQFRVPDLRNQFRRFTGTNADDDSARALGSRQGYEVQSHQHNNVWRPGGTPLAGALASGVYVYGGSTDPYGGSETRPVNVAFFPRIHI